MKKRVVCLVLISLLLINLFVIPILADNHTDTDTDTTEDDTTDTTTDETTDETTEEDTITISTNENLEGVDKGYACLEDKLKDNCGGSTLTEQTVLTLFAIGYDSGLQSDCLDNLMNNENDDCFAKDSSSSCDIKSTAQAVLVLNYLGKDVDNYVSWLEEQKELAKDLNWFLEIDANQETSCTINSKTFTINENKKISGSSSCLSPAESSYYLKISNSCLENNFTTSCDQDFITTLLYKIGSTFYVSSLTNYAATSGTTNEKINSYCFGNTNCNYQESLWATQALAKAGKDISPYLPYLSSKYSDLENKKYFPSTFLYMLTNEDDYYLDVTERQKQTKFWNEQSLSGINYFDTALALTSLQGLSLQEIDNTQEYLLSIQGNDGCWSNIKDTAFTLYGAWPREPIYSGGGGGDGIADCESFSNFCVSASECDNPLNNFDCPGLNAEVCCETRSEELSCTEKNGIKCDEGYECTGSEVYASDTSYCCMASCIESSDENECESYDSDYTCKSSCSDDEEEEFYDCDFSSEICCSPKKKSGSSWLLIILLIILIILVILAIIFRNQLKIWFFKFKSKLKSKKHKPDNSGRPMMMPPGQMGTPRQIIPRQPIPHRRPPMRRPTGTRRPTSNHKDSAFDETMKKLRDMSK